MGAARDSYTGRSMTGLVPWAGGNRITELGQFIQGSNSISKLEIVSALNINNLGRDTMYYHSLTRTRKYNPKIYFKSLNTLSIDSISDDETGQNKKEILWPES